MTARKSFVKIRSDIKAYCVICSLDTKDKIIDYFTHDSTHTKKTTPIIVKGVRLFSIYEFADGVNKTNMLVITKHGVELLDKLCGDIWDEEEFKYTLMTFLCKNITDSDIINSMKRILIPLTQHYFDYRFNSSSPYIPGNLDKRQIFIFYPIKDSILKGLVAMLNRISCSKEDIIDKTQIFIG